VIGLIYGRQLEAASMIEIETNRARGGETTPHHVITRLLALAMAIIVVVMFLSVATQ
jgi:hypothetical protein